MKKTPNQKHKLSGIPTVYEETHKIIDSKTFDQVNIDKMEYDRNKRHEKAILNLINKHGKSKIPLVEKLVIQQETYHEALNNILSLRDHETFETMMLLFEYMEKKKSFRIERLSGTELLKLGGYSGTRQVHRSRILKRIENHAGAFIKVLDPEKSIMNYKSNHKDKGLVYKIVHLIKIEEVVHSIRNPSLVKELVNVAFLPEYIEYLQQISRRYIPLETIRKINKESSTDKTRHFLYKLCFKFAGIQKNECNLTLDECMNLGKFYNKSEVSLKRKWQPIEKALNKGHLFKLLSYQWIFRDPSPHEIIRDDLKVDLFRSIDQSFIKTPLEEKYYKYIDKVRILRAYHLASPKLNLPFDLENEEAVKSSKNIGIDI
jgi:hypothetical protein